MDLTDTTAANRGHVFPAWPFSCLPDAGTQPTEGETMIDPTDEPADDRFAVPDRAQVLDTGDEYAAVWWLD